MGRVLFLTLFSLAWVSTSASAQTTYDANSKYGNGIVNSAGQWANQIGTVGAAANRNAANQLFQQALQHESQGLATLSPSLLSQALTESQQGIKADDQARHLAQTALEALKSGNTAGNVNLQDNYGTSEDQLRDIANNSSPLLPTVQSHLGNYGISVNHDHSVIQSPFGEFPLDAGPEAVTAAASKIAESLGFSGATVGDGVNKAMANAQGIGKKALADAQQAAGVARTTAASTTTAGADAGSTTGAAKGDPTATGDQAATVSGKGTLPTDSKFNISEEDILARKLALEKSRAELKEKFGLGKPQDLADASMNLFLIVHDRYQELQSRGTFEKTSQQQVAALPQH